MLFSIIIPIYKVEKYLNTCVESVLGQDFSDYEIILVDDGSLDRCGEMCDSLAQKDGRISVIHKANGGLSDARNAGIDVAKGEYLLFLDSDDSFKEHALSNIERLISAYSPDVVAGVYEAFDENSDSIIAIMDTDFSKEPPLLSSSETVALFKALNVAPCAWRYAVKRGFLLSRQLYFVKGLLSEDAMWTPRLLCAAGSVALNPEPFYHYVIRDGSIMTTPNFKRFSDIMHICEENYSLASELPSPQKEYINNLNLMILLNMFKDYHGLPKEKKNIVSGWLAAHNELITAALGSRRYILLTSRLIGAKNTFLLAAWAIKAREKIANGGKTRI